MKYPGKPWNIVTVLWLLLSICTVQSSHAQAKKLPDSHISVHVKNKLFQEVLSIIEAQTNFKFAFSNELIQQQKNVSITADNMSLNDILAELLRGTTLTYNIIGTQIVLYNITLPSRVTLSGYVHDAKTGELLIGASISLPQTRIGGLTNNYGFYSITVAPADTLLLEISYVGYKDQILQVSARNNLAHSFDLVHNNREEVINGVTISNDKREDNVKKNQPVIDISSDMIVSTPSAAGDGDVISSVGTLPGVQSGLDGTPGYSVRGGNTGQNLILLDEATLYNPSHIFGLVSIFSAPAIKNVSLLKGGFPASYGDHVSSVLDIAMKDGSKQQAGGIVQLGTIHSGVTLYGPLQTNKSSFLVSARRSMVDLIFRPLLSQNYLSNYYFYDINAKLNFQLSHKDRLFLSFYTGRDNNAFYTDAADSAGINYSMHFGNTAFAARWNHVYSGKLFSNTSLIYNNYHQFLSATQGSFFAQLYSGIRDFNAKTDFSWYLNNTHKISAGANFLYQTLLPASFSQKVSPTDSVSINPGSIPEKNAIRLAAYASDDIKMGPHFKIYLGVRVPVYYQQDTQYIHIEPRATFLYMLNSSTSIKVSYTQMHQYLHLVQSYNSSFPAEVWIGSSAVVKPEVCHQVSAGLFKNFKNNEFQTSIEFYYKSIENQLLFKGGTTSVIDNNLEDQLIVGKGWDYGAEFFVRKNRGRFTGWLSYSLSYAWQQFDSLNLGQRFPFAYDRRHVMYISASYSLDKHWKVSANFFWASGRAFTLKTDTTAALGNPLYDDENSGASVNSTLIAENNYRLSSTNRLDISISYKKSRSSGRRTLDTEWRFSVYNVYARKNTSFAYRTLDPSTKEIVAKEVPFIPIIPSITYSVRF